MTPLIEWALTNAVLAIPFAVLAWAGSWLRRPAITHVLWVLVLLRLFAPPLWRVSIPIQETPTTSSGSVAVSDNGSFPVEPIVRLAMLDNSHSDDASPGSAPTPLAPPQSNPPTDWSAILTGIWMGGAIGCVGLAVVRAIRFQRMLFHSVPAPQSWQHMSERLARRIGLRGSPPVLVTQGSIAPLLWAGFGRPRLLLPARLVHGLDGVRRAALLTHELAHYRRGDYWIRWIELAATALYWWHPLLWWMRRGLREAEEQCCDAWVVWTLPAARRAYADVLVDTVEFLSASRTVLPALASGLGEVRHLRRRVIMIMQNTAPRRLSRLGLMAGLAIALGLLSIAPGRGQDDQERQPPRARGQDQDAPRPDARRNEETERLRAEIRELRERLAQAERRLAEREGRIGAGRGNDPTGSDGRGGGRGIGRGGSNDAPVRPDRFGRGDRGPGDAPAPMPPADGPRGAGRSAGPDRQGDGGQAERRIRELERELVELRRDIAEMRREMRGPQPRRQPAPPSAPSIPAPSRPSEPPSPPDALPRSTR